MRDIGRVYRRDVLGESVRKQTRSSTDLQKHLAEGAAVSGKHSGPGFEQVCGRVGVDVVHPVIVDVLELGAE